MGGFIGAGAIVVFFAAVLTGLAVLGRRVRRRGKGGYQAFVGPFEEIWHPAAHRARLETEIVEERLVPLPPAGDGPRRRPSRGADSGPRRKDHSSAQMPVEEPR